MNYEVTFKNSKSIIISQECKEYLWKGENYRDEIFRALPSGAIINIEDIVCIIPLHEQENQISANEAELRLALEPVLTADNMIREGNSLSTTELLRTANEYLELHQNNQ